MSPILRPSSVSSSSSSNSSSISTKPRKPPYIPFARRRLTAAQTDALVAVFQVKTHPSREERAVLAADLTMEMKAVNAWFQNKRRSLKKQSSMWTRASLPENRHVKPSPSSNPRTVTSQGFGISLDFIAASHELPYKGATNHAPSRPPLTSRKQNIIQGDTGDLWEHIPSSPPAAPSSPAAESVRLSALPARSRTMRSLEWACAKARAGRSMRGNDEDHDVPMLVLDNITRDLEECSDTDTEDEEAITPDVSADDMGELFSFRELSMDMEKAPSEDMEAAMALLKFKARRA